MTKPRRTTWLMTAIALLSILVLVGCGLSAPLSLPSGQAAATQAAPTVAVTSSAVATAAAPQASLPPATGALADLQGRLEQVYAQVSPSVVTIRTVQTQTVNSPITPEIPGFPFFGLPTPQGPQTQIQQALGSGFVWDKEGHIVTNNHVVDGADQITVTFHDGTTVAAKLVGADPDSDLAVLKVDVPAGQLQPVQMADSTQVKVGQLAIAIGNPFGEESTMTLGIVSALGRTLPVNDGVAQGPTYTIPDVIQTDAPINPGNSGGVLLNDQGQVIGVTSAIESPVRASSGIGFAIPAAIVQKVVPALIQTGHYEHTWLGISGTSLNPDLAKAMNLNENQRGALVVDIVPDSPADKADLHGSDRQATINGEPVPVGGDVIVAIDGQPVNSFADLVAYLADSTQVGQIVSLTVLRQGQQETIRVTLAARPNLQTQSRQAQGGASGPAAGAWLGIQGLTVTPQIAQAMNLPSSQTGVLVERVETGSPADQAGLRGSFKSLVINGRRLLVGGDIITAVDGQSVTRLADLQALLQQAQPGQTIRLTLLRNGQQVEAQVTLAQQPATMP